jgi:hypothetical protein
MRENRRSGYRAKKIGHPEAAGKAMVANPVAIRSAGTNLE